MFHVKQWKVEIHYKGNGVISGIFPADSMDEAIEKARQYFNAKNYYCVSAQVKED